MPTLCEDCEHVINDDKTPPYRWMCIKHPRIFDGFVSREKRVTSPYAWCKDVNYGACPVYEERKNNANRRNNQE